MASSNLSQSPLRREITSWPPASITLDEVLQRRGYKITGSLGEGSYAKVKKGHSDRHHCQVAIKIVDRNKAPEDFTTKFLPREMAVHRQIKHPSCVEVFDLFEVGHKVYFIMELAGHGDLLDFIKLRSRIPEPEAKLMFRQLIEVLHYLHNKGIVHRDLKCENILLDIYNNIKLSDFGFSRYIEPTHSVLSGTYCGSAAYAAPEILRGRPYSPFEADLWSVGVVLFIMVNGTMPFDDTNLRRMLRSQEARKIHFSSKVRGILSHEVKFLIRFLLEPTISRRAKINNVIKSDWLMQTQYSVRTSQTSQAIISDSLSNMIQQRIEIMENTAQLESPGFTKPVTDQAPTIIPLDSTKSSDDRICVHDSRHDRLR